MSESEAKRHGWDVWATTLARFLVVGALIIATPLVAWWLYLQFAVPDCGLCHAATSSVSRAASAADAETILADLEERAAKGDQSAKDYLEATTAAAT